MEEALKREIELLKQIIAVKDELIAELRKEKKSLTYQDYTTLLGPKKPYDPFETKWALNLGPSSWD